MSYGRPPSPKRFNRNKLTKYNKKEKNINLKMLSQNINTQNDKKLSNYQSKKFVNINTLFSFISEHNISLENLSNQTLNNVDQSNIQQYENFQVNQSLVNIPQKQPINNMIFEEESYELEPKSNYLQTNNNLELLQEEQIKIQN
ncbi:hypothetical protein TTHERM_00609370 (macronuclear) [Tetrahymena thermophila SB210]|uniref:Uncharacterized protein n=1 Tax=Tetrahymena thermophila (strain SB210) TaxID=312017 RepID=Q22YF2_TETTS|nr:hypothetical protein TTHERM_00609370 [Tetrahymena thermophila SB210]EAR90333.1 hypothetical protein TTHERM_00609370 [Tetrahymena thermophila SB210]|eukprot:XP_001010578.1 hypothetical protein TTHERM_00609370 [Tetrahymena thermophila SB210]